MNDLDDVSELLADSSFFSDHDILVGEPSQVKEGKVEFVLCIIKIKSIENEVSEGDQVNLKDCYQLEQEFLDLIFGNHKHKYELFDRALRLIKSKKKIFD